MGTVIDNEKTKLKCQIFTPIEVVNSMLDYIGYSANLYGKSFLDSSCGKGAFLIEAARRYIIDCQSNGLSRTKIKNGLGRDIFGIELDPFLYQECLNSLNKLTDSFNIKRVTWQIKHADALRDPFQRHFDYIVGNPPYVSYWDLDQTERSYVESTYSVCRSGAWDYSYAFLQDGYGRLEDKGKMAYIVPNSIFKTNSGKSVRNLLRPFIIDIYDYTTTNVFGKVLTSPAILVVDKAVDSSQISYHDLSKNTHQIINRNSLGDTWLFDRNKYCANATHRFGDYCNVNTSIATQCNNVFVLQNWDDDGRYLCRGDEKIEKEAVRNAASPRGKANGLKEFIIFPYYYFNDKLMHYSEDEFKDRFPLAYKYLSNERKKLEKRDADKNSQWFEYGRSQALKHINCEKLLISTIVTGKVRIYKLEYDEVPYSGLYITVKDNAEGFSIDSAAELLSSSRFLEYIIPRGINAHGKSIRIVANNILNYRW